MKFNIEIKNQVFSILRLCYLGFGLTFILIPMYLLRFTKTLISKLFLNVFCTYTYRQLENILFLISCRLFWVKVYIDPSAFDTISCLKIILVNWDFMVPILTLHTRF